jgi:hypothetical protein
VSWPCFLIVEHVPRVEQVVGHRSDSDLHRNVVHRFEGFQWNDRMAVDDLIWPDVCPTQGCDYALDYEGDEFSSGWRTLLGTTSWRRLDGDEVHDDQHDFGPGAMYDATPWTPGTWRGPDGRCWAIVLPPAGRSDFWLIDGEASGGGRWTRTGTPPVISVTPSILTPNYHGFLQGGVLTDSLPDRPLS